VTPRFRRDNAASPGKAHGDRRGRSSIPNFGKPYGLPKSLIRHIEKISGATRHNKSLFLTPLLQINLIFDLIPLIERSPLPRFAAMQQKKPALRRVSSVSVTFEAIRQLDWRRRKAGISR
jgi:hypothetical protein